MFLVPAEMYEKQGDVKTTYSLPHPALANAKTTKILTLDDRLKDTLQNPHFNSDMKARLYQEMLQEYLTIKKTDPQAIQTVQPQVIKTVNPGSLVQKQEAESKVENQEDESLLEDIHQELEDHVLDDIPLSQYKKADHLLKKLTFRKRTGELIDSDGQVLKGSNVKKLIKGHLSTSQGAKRKSRKLIGYSSFQSQIGKGYHERYRWSSF